MTDAELLAKVTTFAQKLHSSGISLMDKPISSEQAEVFAKGLIDGEENAVKTLFYRTLFYMCMGVAKRDDNSPPYPLKSHITQPGTENVRPILERMVEKGIAEEDISRVIKHYERWAAYSALFSFAETLESSWTGLERLLDELGYYGTDDKDELLGAIKANWGAANFDDEGNFAYSIDVAHEYISPDDFFEEHR